MSIPKFPVLLVPHETEQPLFQIEDIRTYVIVFREKRVKIFTMLNLEINFTKCKKCIMYNNKMIRIN